MKYTTNQPIRWFALGAFAAWYAGMLVGTRSTPNTSRWNTEEGVWIGAFAAMFAVFFLSLPFAVWLKWRRRGRPDLRPKFFAL